MSDSSEDEDLSRFQEAVDTSFTKLINETRGIPQKEEKKSVSERYLETPSHYNDVKVPEKMQKQIGVKISKIIEKNVEFVDMEANGVKKRKIKGGVKLFSNSVDFLSPEAAVDTYAETHNAQSREMMKKKRRLEERGDENDKIAAAAVSGEYILSKEETKCWKSRRKEKLFKYKSQKNSKVLTAID
ncbi:uncharacterized protein LOC125236355 [Leguminivora glycinivorella]|uniref:uncharacterized protein LOC125236355 n=1 Tax=Leguminivora glycinivorella TaxID=1035111 RepID=UPI00200D561E|nr:uncharacterized protein LOC125236355 [Leguminivora glycinivorella]